MAGGAQIYPKHSHNHVEAGGVSGSFTELQNIVKAQKGDKLQPLSHYLEGNVVVADKLVEGVELLRQTLRTRRSV